MSVVTAAIGSVDWLKQKAYEWALDVKKLYNTTVPADLAAEKDKLINRAKTIKETIEKLTGPLSPLAPINEMGAVWFPVIGAVGVAGAAAAIAYWYTDYRKFVERLKLNQQLIGEGIASQAERNVLIDKAMGNTSLVEKLFNPRAFVPLALVIVGGLYFWRNN